MKSAEATVQSLFSRDLAGVPGKELSMIAVEYPPGGTDPVHTHHAQALVYVPGPQQFRFDELIRQGLGAGNDPREVVVDPHARYFGADLGERSLIPAS